MRRKICDRRREFYSFYIKERGNTMLNKLVKTCIKYMEEKIESANRKYLEKQAVMQKEQERLAADNIMVRIKPHIEAAVFGCVYFSDTKKIQIVNCKWDAQSQSWRILVETVVKKDLLWTSPRILLSLNDAFNLHLKELNAEYQDECQQLRLRKVSQEITPEKLQLAAEQLRYRYDILNHHTAFHRIETSELGNRMVLHIWISFL